MSREPAPFATAEVRHGGWSYRAVMYDEWAGSYAGAARRTEYFRYDGEWKPIPWDAVPKPAYRQLRVMLRDPAQRTLDEENPMTNPRLRPWHIAKGLISPSSTRNATPLTAEQQMAAHEAGYEEASRLQAKYRWSHPGRDFRDEALLNVLGRDRRVPRNLTERDPDFWEWVEAILAGVDDATGRAPVESYRGVSEARPYRGGRRSESEEMREAAHYDPGRGIVDPDFDAAVIEAANKIADANRSQYRSRKMFIGGFTQALAPLVPYVRPRTDSEWEDFEAGDQAARHYYPAHRLGESRRPPRARTR
jgi:hypothetical protein